jgi:hypothetical protein
MGSVLRLRFVVVLITISREIMFNGTWMTRPPDPIPGCKTTVRQPVGAGKQRIITDFIKPVGEVFSSAWKDHHNKFIFLIIPVFYLINATAIHYNIGRFFMDNVDPEYFFLYNGTIIGEGSLSVQYTSNPGTPLMFLIAISNRIVSVFQPGDYIGDVVDDPEKYIHAANMLLVLLLAVTLFLSGWYAGKVSGSRIAGLILQLSLPGSAALMFLSGLVKSEAMTILPVLFLSMAIFHYIFSDDGRETASNRTLVLFGLIAGFGIACKLTFIPMVLVPLILLKSTIGQKLKLLAYTLLSIAVFAYPIVFNNGHFWDWVGGILSHTGKYGEGKAGFIDFDSIPVNLERLFNNEKSFFYVTAVSLILGIILSLKIIHRRMPEQSNRIIRAILAVSIAIIGTIALVLKHFEVHYFISFYVLKFLLISLIYLLIIRFDIIKRSLILKGISIGIVTLVVIYISYSEALKINKINKSYLERKAQQEERYQKVMSVFEEGSPVILTCRFSGAPFVEFAHYSGFMMSFHLTGSFKPYLKEKFPVSYLYVPWSEEFYFWNDFVDFQEILNKTEKSFYIFIGEKKAGDLPAIEERIWQVLDKTEVSREVVYQDARTGEHLIKMTLLSKIPSPTS